MERHQLKLDFRDGKIVTSCEYGQWQREHFIQAGESAAEIIITLEREYAEHVGPSAGQTAASAPKPAGS